MREYNLDDIKTHQAVTVAAKHGKDRSGGTQVMLSRVKSKERPRGEAVLPGDAALSEVNARLIDGSTPNEQLQPLLPAGTEQRLVVA